MTRSREKAHPGPEEIRALAAGSAEVDDPAGETAREAARRHVAGCRECADELRLVGAVARAMSALVAGDCPPAERLVALADGIRRDEGERAPLESHLTACLACAAELEALVRAGASTAKLPAAAPLLHRGLDSLAARIRALISFEMPLSLALTTRNGVAAVDSSLQRGMELYRAGRYDEALTHLEAARAAGEKAAELAFFLGACRFRAGRMAEAAEAFAEAVRRSPRLGEYRWFLAQALLELGRPEEAIQSLKKAAGMAGPFKQKSKVLARTLAGMIEAGKTSAE